MSIELLSNEILDVPKAELQGVNGFDPDKRVDVKEVNTVEKSISGFDPDKRIETNENKDNLPIQNKIDGLEREKQVAEELKEQYPSEKGYDIVPEALLRDKYGNVVKDPETNEARRVDFVVVKDGKVVDSVEVTSMTAEKTQQMAKEDRIRENGGNFIKDSNGNLAEMSYDIHTRIERRG